MTPSLDGYCRDQLQLIPALTESCTVNLSATHVLKIKSVDISRVQDDLQKFWDLETLGIRDTETSVHDKFSNEISFTGEAIIQGQSPYAVR